MPWSSDEGKEWAAKELDALLPMEPHVIDVGAGAGAWGRIIRRLRPKARLTAVEIWLPYVERFGLWDLYDTVICADVTAGSVALHPAPNLIVFGDVLEHMDRAGVVRAMSWARWQLRCSTESAHILASVPLGDWPQGEEEGNPYEAHVSTWTDGLVRETFGEPVSSTIEDSVKGQIGVYLWEVAHA